MTREIGSPIRWGPKPADHPSIGRPCSRCKRPFVAGDMTRPDPTTETPADPDEFLKKAAGRSYIAHAEEMHVRCVVDVDAIL